MAASFTMLPGPSEVFSRGKGAGCCTRAADGQTQWGTLSESQEKTQQNKSLQQPTIWRFLGIVYQSMHVQGMFRSYDSVKPTGHCRRGAGHALGGCFG